MPTDARIAFAVHASAVAIGGQGLLIAGRSKAGKSRLAFALIAASTPRLPIVLIGDDRILLDRYPDGALRARPHPRIAGFIERRGLGLVAMPWQAAAALGGLLQLGDGDALAGPAFSGLPRLNLGGSETRFSGIDGLLAWWRVAVTKQHAAGTKPVRAPCDAKDWNW